MEKINIALSQIEDSLKKIDSARQQVEKVTLKSDELTTAAALLISEMNVIADVIKKDFSKIYQERFEQIAVLSENFTNSIAGAAKSYLVDNNNLITSKLNELSTVIDDFKNEVSRLVTTDFSMLFIELQKVFIDQTREDLDKELNKFEEKSKVLQSKIEQLQSHVERLEKIDIEKHFDIFQKTLSDIFGAINAVNFTVTNVVQTLTAIIQTLGSIQIAIDTNHKEIKQHLQNLSESIVQHLIAQDNKASENTLLIERKINALSEQNKSFEKQIITNRIIQIAGFTCTMGLLLYLLLR